MRKFIEQFTKKKLYDDADVKKINDDYFLVQPELSSVLKKLKLPPLATGLYLGRMTEKTARPSLDLLQMLAKTEAKRAVVNAKGAWMFICRRPVLKNSVVKCDAQPDELVLVVNERDECLGYGLFSGKEVKNYFDIGDFLRRERRAKRA